MTDAVFLPPGEGETHRVGGSTLVLKALGDTTAGSLFLSESTIEPGFPGPPLHVHRTLHDMFYVLEGTLTLRLGDEVIEAPAGSFACAPPGTPHTFSNQSSEPVRILNMNTPAGFEEYMRALGAAFSGSEPPTPAEIASIAGRFDFEVA